MIIHSNIRGKTENQMGLIKVHGQSTYDIDRKNIIGVDEVSEQYIEKNTVMVALFNEKKRKIHLVANCQMEMLLGNKVIG